MLIIISSGMKLGRLFTKRMNVLPPYIALKSYWHLGCAAAEMAFKFKSDRKSLNPNLVVSKLHEILR